jgi:hypothetical protein
MEEDKGFEYPFIRWSIREGTVFGVAHVNGSGDASWYALTGGRDIEQNHVILEENPYEKGIKTFEIAPNTFRGTDFKTMKLPSSLLAIHDYAFYESGIESIDFSPKLRYVDNFAFARCHHLKEIHNDAHDLHLGYWCFSNCDSLVSIHLNSTSFVPGCCFYGCLNLKDAYIEGALYIDKTAFQYEEEGLAKNIGVTLHAKKGSYVESFAKENGYRFMAIED